MEHVCFASMAAGLVLVGNGNRWMAIDSARRCWWNLKEWRAAQPHHISAFTHDRPKQTAGKNETETERKSLGLQSWGSRYLLILAYTREGCTHSRQRGTDCQCSAEPEGSCSITGFCGNQTIGILYSKLKYIFVYSLPLFRLFGPYQ